jgi:non-specific serine/threonine protein kinase
MCVDPTQALAAATESLRLFQHIADAWGVAHATFSIGMARAASGVFDDSLDEILVPWRALGDQWGTAQALNFLGDVARRQNRDARARRLYEEALALLRELEMPGTVPSILQNLGYVAVRSGDAQAAIRLFRESLVLFRNQGDRRGMADCLEGLAGALTVMKEPEHAARVLGAADALRASTGTAVWRANAADVAASVEKLHEQLAEGQFTAIRAAGRSLTVEDLLAGLESATRAASNQACRDSPLSAREVEVATLVTRGLTNKEIAARLVISERTAATHVARILDKLGLSTRAQIAAWGAQAGLLEQSRGTRGFGAEKGSAILRIAGTPREIS